MRDNIVTITQIQERDITGQLTDTTAVEAALRVVLYDLVSRVGHDWGDSTGTETLDGVISNTLYLAGETQYPLRTLESIEIDDYEIDTSKESEFRIIRNRAIGNLGIKLRRYGATWKGNRIDITGVWGWEETPDDVVEAVFRLVYKAVVGSTVTGSSSGSTGSNIKRIRHGNKYEIEYQRNAAVAQQISTYSTGDLYADEIVRKYKWTRYGGVV